MMTKINKKIMGWMLGILLVGLVVAGVSLTIKDAVIPAPIETSYLGGNITYMCNGKTEIAEIYESDIDYQDIVSAVSCSGEITNIKHWDGRVLKRYGNKYSFNERDFNLKYYCVSKDEYQECLFGISGGIGTRCYKTKEQNSWFYCKEGWIIG